jgi:hypothetical protein
MFRVTVNVCDSFRVRFRARDEAKVNPGLGLVIG